MSRLRKRAGTEDFLQQHESIILNPETWRGRWHEVFGIDRPLHLELGMGKGEFIAKISHRHQEHNYIGIDLYDELVRRACEKATEVHGKSSDFDVRFSNLRLVRMNIRDLSDAFGPGEVQQIYLNFSDPWPKKRHEQRRLTHEHFMKMYLSIVAPGGSIQLRTDSRELFEFSLNTFADLELKLKNIHLDLHGSGTPNDHIFTEYEEKFVGQKLPIFQCEVHV